MDTTDTILIEIPRRWWELFMMEPIIDDAENPNTTDDNLIQIKRIIDTPAVSQTKKVRRILADYDMVECLYDNADWYAYYWGEALASEEWDFGPRGAWQARGRASRQFARQLKSIMRGWSETA
jgi:hypothetical protein